MTWFGMTVQKPGHALAPTGPREWLVVLYRSFQNSDPPGLAEVWNEALTGRGAVILRHSSPLERHVFAKPYFEPNGLVVAIEGNRRLGFVHAGFGPNHTGTGLSTTTGVICVLAVRPEQQRQGIGTQLLEHAEAYARGRGARSIVAGPMHPVDPFYFGLYGGCRMPGYLASDAAAGGFFESRGYGPMDTCLVLQRPLDRPLSIADGRFPGLRRRYVFKPAPCTGIVSWWKECTMGVIDPVEFRLEESIGGRLVARAEVWEMEGFSWRWGVPTVGILDLVVDEAARRQGVAKFLLANLMQYLQEQYFGLVEAHVMERNQAGVKLFQTLGFEQVDIGRNYRLLRQEERRAELL
jgi:ribosomal protein S18 acetylase RimI-like enzyme